MSHMLENRTYFDHMRILDHVKLSIAWFTLVKQELNQKQTPKQKQASVNACEASEVKATLVKQEYQNFVIP